MSDKSIGEFELVDHGIDGSQYFQGCGTSFTSWEYVATGHGDNPSEAINDLLDCVAQHQPGFNVENMEARIRDEYLKGEKIPETPSAHENMLAANGKDGEFTPPEDLPCPVKNDFANDGDYDDAMCEWESSMDEAEEEWDKEKEELTSECDMYYYMSLRWNE